ncbi:hypothetical protein [Flammeovirga sp. OC4]|uniref:hypothetical protein n=1 Tax=Flammeovirga sp. OC4 TaxID=1382345 RepID=UPI0005C631C5|nr:hypothetical protein [Flammeovirga sp. OC4]
MEFIKKKWSFIIVIGVLLSNIFTAYYINITFREIRFPYDEEEIMPYPKIKHNQNRSFQEKQINQNSSSQNVYLPDLKHFPKEMINLNTSINHNTFQKKHKRVVSSRNKILIEYPNGVKVYYSNPSSNLDLTEIIQLY